VEIGCTDVFSVPGDFNLILLDHLLAEPGLNNIGCCNEINAGYAADGYARWKGVGAVVVTFTVGGLSVINSIAGAYSENLPLICIVGGPNSNDFGSNRILHHTIGIPDFSQEFRCFQTVTCYQAMSYLFQNPFSFFKLPLQIHFIASALASFCLLEIC
jgi:pyruvate decarboxylase